MTPEKPKDLNLDSTPKEKFHALIDAAECFNSDLASVIGRDDDEKLLFVAVHAKGEDAAALERWLQRRSKHRL
jgi:hypothetical protein